ncbi:MULTISPECIES: AbiJ-NTD4 domain-containing protein [unclassified Rhodanobacter]|uniref:AbiJ-NTD4 domain-containing protein n=1 Tax=Rhodanobacter humi TaxID=1888173 RepID=A0ABV4ALH0_9GAMM
MRFSQRQGYSPTKDAIQTESMDDALRNSLWNVLQVVIWDTHKSKTPYSYTSHSNLFSLLRTYWSDYFKSPVDQIPHKIQDTIKAVRRYFFESEWYEVYDFMEFSCNLLGQSRSKFIALCNEVLEQEVSGYRLIDCKVTPITSEAELAAIEDSLAATKDNSGANAHLRRALELLSDRSSPDYRNSIKESISAVEALVKALVGDSSATLGAALKVISEQAPMHPALNRSLNSLYGYTSDASGIRHALLDDPNLDFIDAKFMLVACSAFVNYLRML